MFNHIPLTLPKLERIEIDGKRHYVTPNGDNYLSITTLLSYEGKESIENWKQRIGVDKANKISKNSSERGTELHELLEKHINNEVAVPTERTKYMFNTLKPIVNRNISNVRCQEAALYSDKLQIAGTCDIIADWNGNLSVIDFKNSTKTKREEWITNYFIQCSFYALCVGELLSIKIPQIVVLIAVENDYPQIFVKRTKDYIKPLLDLKRKYI
jgi:genome maintenance exonuclease 1